MKLTVLKLITTALLPAVVFLGQGCSGEPGTKASGTKSLLADCAVQLTGLDGKAMGTALDSSKTTVFVFLSPDCPLCQSYSATLSDISDSIKACTMQFVGVFTGTDYTAAEIAAYRDSFPVRFTCAFDRKSWLCGLLGATVTPEAFVVSAEGKTLYKGRIDDWMYDVGQKRPAPTRFDLRQALSEICSGQPVRVPETKAVGCFIEKP